MNYRNIQYNELKLQADEIQNTWQTIRTDLINKINLFLIESHENRANLTVNLWEISNEYRQIDRNRVLNLRNEIFSNLRLSLKSELYSNDEIDQKIFEEFNDHIEDILISTNKEINDIDHQPAPLRTFIRDLDIAPTSILDTIRNRVFQFNEKYPFEDDIVYQFINTAEQMSLCLDSIKKMCHSIMEEYVRDKRETYKRLYAISKCEDLLDARPQVNSVLDMIINTIEADSSIKHELNDQDKVITIRNKSIDKTITSFLSDNKLPGIFY